MDEFLRRLFPGWEGGRGPQHDDRRPAADGADNGGGGGAVRRNHPRRRKSAAAAGPAPEERDTRAFHESLWKPGNLPRGVPPPRTERVGIFGRGERQVVATNVLVAVLGAPGVGVRSLIQRVRFGDMDRTQHEVPFAVGLPQYLCDGSVYTLGLARLPFEGFSGSGLAVASERIAVVLAYAVDSPASLEVAKGLQRRLIGELEELQQQEQHQQQQQRSRHGPRSQREDRRPDSERSRGPETSAKPPPFPVMLLGLRSDLTAQRSGGEGDDHGVAAEHRHDDSGGGDRANEVKRERARKLEAWGFAWSRSMLHAECSARSGDGVLEALGELVEAVDSAGKADGDPEDTLEEMRACWVPAVAAVARATAEETGQAGT